MRPHKTMLLRAPKRGFVSWFALVFDIVSDSVDTKMVYKLGQSL